MTVREAYRKEWYQCQSRKWKVHVSREKPTLVILLLLIHGHGGSTVRSPSKALPIPGFHMYSYLLYVQISDIAKLHQTVFLNDLNIGFCCRGYYRCSSSKGCPARKQVERSRVDPTMLVVTYSSEHNHPWPPSRNHHNHHHSASSKLPIKQEAPTTHTEPDPEPEPEERFADLGDESSMMTGDEFRWFGEMETTTSTVLESPIFAESNCVRDAATDAGMVFPMREEDESLFADLGELPECSVVFRHRGVGPRVEIY